MELFSQSASQSVSQLVGQSVSQLVKTVSLVVDASRGQSNLVGKLIMLQDGQLRNRVLIPGREK
jgi:hypothetical protein